MEVGSVTAPRVRANRYFFTKREGSQNQAVVYWREGVSGESRVLIDPAALDASGLTTVEWFSCRRDLGRDDAFAAALDAVARVDPAIAEAVSRSWWISDVT